MLPVLSGVPQASILGLQFNTSKCKVMKISSKRNRPTDQVTLTINGHLLQYADSYRYLGGNFSSDLSWHTHISSLCKKSWKQVSLLYRNFAAHTPPSTMLKLYKSFVRPSLEYASIVWNPYLKSHINNLEKVQKFAIKVCQKIWDSFIAYDKLLQLAELLSPKHRIEVSCLCHLFKILSNLTDHPPANSHIKQRVVPYNSRFINEYTLELINARMLT